MPVERTLLIGSGNRDKRKELSELLTGSGWRVLSLDDLPDVEEPAETADTFEGNALLKAQYYRDHFGFSCVADDSGLEVEALGGAPGVYSARYAGEHCTYTDNNRKLIEALRRKVLHERRARFVCCAAFAGLSGNVHIEFGTVTGCIVEQPRGERGFGYDPLFLPDGSEKTFAQMDTREKHEISHRGRAFARMAEFLRGIAE
jgi:XTP/dITP diphosphohydrolase